MTREEAMAILEVSKHMATRGRMYNQAIDMAIEALQAKVEWIPCSERLPKEKQEVYVTVYFIEGDTGRAYGYIDGFGKWHLYSTVEGTLNSGYEVTAWMPLPKPYKGGDDECV